MDMEEDEIQAQPSKLPRVGNGSTNDFINNKIVSKANSNMNNEQCPDDEEDGELRRRNNGGSTDGSTNRFQSWSHSSSRIVRVSRASSGKDRHSKVMTSKGLRDRRVRLSVSTAIQFYDLQDRLGYDQPSKAVEWLINAASDAISELPSLNHTFPDCNSKQPSDEQREEQGFDDSVEGDLDGDEGSFQQNQSQNLSRSKSACSSTSETSKGSGLALSRSEIRVKARERARERAAKEKEKENESGNISHHHNVNHISQTASFTELLLTGGINGIPTSTASPNGSVHQNHAVDEPNLINKGARQQQWLTTPLDYFGSGLFGQSPSSRTTHHQSSGLSGQIQLGNSMNPQTMSVSPFNVTTENHSDQLQPFSFMPDHLIPVVTSQPGNGDYNLNFTISSGLAGFNRGTLQSNSPSLLPHHLSRFSPIDGSSNVPLFRGAAPTMDNHNNHHHQFPPSGFDGRLQLYYGDGRHSDHKDKGKN